MDKGTALEDKAETEDKETSLEETEAKELVLAKEETEDKEVVLEDKEETGGKEMALADLGDKTMALEDKLEIEDKQMVLVDSEDRMVEKTELLAATSALVATLMTEMEETPALDLEGHLAVEDGEVTEAREALAALVVTEVQLAMEVVVETVDPVVLEDQAGLEAMVAAEGLAEIEDLAATVEPVAMEDPVALADPEVQPATGDVAVRQDSAATEALVDLAAVVCLLVTRLTTRSAPAKSWPP